MSVINLLVSAGRRFSEWRHRQQAYAELMALDDHSLADIGLHRSQIAGLVEGYRVPDPSVGTVPLPEAGKARPAEGGLSGLPAEAISEMGASAPIFISDPCRRRITRVDHPSMTSR